MENSEMNNEFILLRHAVRQARVCVVNKLIREAKLLRDRHGHEAQREKCGRKADKLIAEVYALKTIKDDDISRFGILNERGLSEILQDQSSSSSVCIIARVVHYKTLNRRLLQFKEKFPDCKRHLVEKNKKKKPAKSKDKDATRTRKSKEKSSQNKGSKKHKVAPDENVEQSRHDSEDEKAHNDGSSETRGNSRKCKRTLDEDCVSSGKQKLLKPEKDDASKEATVDRQSSVIKPSSVTKEGTIKRFAELLEEQEVNQDTRVSVEGENSAGTATEQVKMSDDFFITTDGQSYQGNNASTSCTNTRSHRHNTRAKTFASNDRIKRQNTNRKNDTSFNEKRSGKQSFSMKSEKMASNKINKSANKSNASENVNKKDDSAGFHPSWMAKKREQEIMTQGFQGKKIVFTDD